MIILDNIWKSYRVRPVVAGNSLRRLAARARSFVRPRYHDVLRGVSLEIPPGDSVALLGANGCGKTTLLRLVCGITRPNAGRLCVRGRVGGLVELTAGFHDDLTGLENVFLNGVLLGLTRQQIRQRLESILDFAELGEFIHTPVKHYSWGMLLRLGFAVAVHADLDILVVDEALAVGDGYFQWKCLQRIEQLKSEGKTLLFVSHVPAQAEAVCRRAVWLHDGRIRADGEAAIVAKRYTDDVVQTLLGDQPSELPLELLAFVPTLRLGTGQAIIREVRLLDEMGRTCHSFRTGETAVLELTVDVSVPLEDLTVIFQFDQPNRPVVKSYTHHHFGTFALRPGRHVLRLRFPELRLYDGIYYVTVALRAASAEIYYDAFVHTYTFAMKNEKQAFSTRALDTGAQLEWVAAPNAE